jgi:hypothetical protein
MINQNKLKKFFKKNNILTIDEYEAKLHTNIHNTKTVEDGFVCMIPWKDDAFRWAGPYDGDYVYCIVEKIKTTKTELDVFNNTKDSAIRSGYNYNLGLLEKLGMDNDYFTRPYQEKDGVYLLDHLCNYISQLNDKELEIIRQNQSETDKMFFELNFAKYITQKDMLPSSQPTVEHPYRLYLAGNDDCSYTMFYNMEDGLDKINKDIYLSWNAWEVLFNRAWYLVEDKMFFSN